MLMLLLNSGVAHDGRREESASVSSPSVTILPLSIGITRTAGQEPRGGDTGRRRIVDAHVSSMLVSTTVVDAAALSSSLPPPPLSPSLPVGGKGQSTTPPANATATGLP